MTSKPRAQFLIAPMLLLLLSVSKASSAPSLYYTEVTSVPAGAFVCVGGRDFPTESNATVYFNSARTCSTSSFTTYDLNWTIGTAPNHFCVQMPSSGSCGTVDSIILSDGSSSSNSLSLSRHSGTVYWVNDSTGNDSNNCLSDGPGNACETIRGALGKSGFGRGDVALVRSGTYREDDNAGGIALYISSSRGDEAGTESQPTTLQGYPGDWPIVLNDGTHNCNVGIHLDRPWWQITGIRTKAADGNAAYDPNTRWAGNRLNESNQDGCDTSGPAGSGVFVSSSAHDGFFVGNDANDNGCCDTNLDHGIYLTASRWEIAYNEFARNSFGIHLYSGNTDTIADNVIYNNHVHGNTNGGSSSCAILQGFRNIFYNNLLENCEGQGVMVKYRSPADSQIFNNTIYNNGSDCIYIEGASGTVVKNNICYSNGSDSIVQSSSSGTIASNNHLSSDGDPMFVNPAAGDFTLQSDSPAVNAGTTPPSSRAFDFERRSAPYGGIHDQGGFESQGGSSGNPPPAAVTNLRRSDTR